MQAVYGPEQAIHLAVDPIKGCRMGGRACTKGWKRAGGHQRRTDCRFNLRKVDLYSGPGPSFKTWLLCVLYGRPLFSFLR